MNVSKEYHDALVETRDQAYRELAQAREEIEHKFVAVEELQNELDNAHAELAEANQDRQPSDMADDIVEVFSRALTEWLTMYDFGTTLGLGQGDYIRPLLLADLHYVLRHTGKSVDEVLDEWGVGDDQDIPLGGLQSLVSALESLTTMATGTAVEAPFVCNDPECECQAG